MLPVAGLMSDKPAEAVAEEVGEFKKALRESGFPGIEFLIFLSLPVIPSVRLTDVGIVDVISQRITDIFEI